MPTRTGGLPQRGEVWERITKLPPDWQPQTVRFAVIYRGDGEYWSMRVYVPGTGYQLWVDPAYWFQQGELRYVGKAGPETRRKLGLA